MNRFPNTLTIPFFVILFFMLYFIDFWYEPILNFLHLPSSCLFRYYTNIPCPFCDLTHSLHLATHFRIIESFKLNPLAIIIILLLIATLTMSIISRKLNYNVTLSKKKVLLIIIFILILCWILRIIIFI